jgi:hypothetical protein
VTVASPGGLQVTAEQISGMPPGGVTSQHSLPKITTHVPPGHSLSTVQFAFALEPLTHRVGEIGGCPAGHPPTEGMSMHIEPPS